MHETETAMTDRDASKQQNTQEDLQHYPAEKARQGEIILRKPWQRVVFIGGLAGVVVLALAFILTDYWLQA